MFPITMPMKAIYNQEMQRFQASGKHAFYFSKKILTFSYFWRKKKYKFLVFFRGDFL